MWRQHYRLILFPDNRMPKEKEKAMKNDRLSIVARWEFQCKFTKRVFFSINTIQSLTISACKYLFFKHHKKNANWLNLKLLNCEKLGAKNIKINFLFAGWLTVVYFCAKCNFREREETKQKKICLLFIIDFRKGVNEPFLVFAHCHYSRLFHIFLLFFFFSRLFQNSFIVVVVSADVLQTIGIQCICVAFKLTNKMRIFIFVFVLHSNLSFFVLHRLSLSATFGSRICSTMWNAGDE